MDSFGNTPVPQSPSARSHINELPLEVLVRVFSNVEPVRLNTLRLVCRYWNHAVLDKETWSRSFLTKFGVGSEFPSTSGTRQWITEYFSRAKALKKWNKGVGVHKCYHILDHEFQFTDKILVDFKADKISTLDLYTGNVAMANGSDGRNQSFVPGSNSWSAKTCYDMNWNYVVYGAGEFVYVKNLATSTSIGLTRSTLRFQAEEAGREVVAVVVNPHPDKHKQRADIVTWAEGVVRLWSVQGAQIATVLVDSTGTSVGTSREITPPAPTARFLGCDFRTAVVAITSTDVIIVDVLTHDVTQFPHGVQELRSVSFDFGGQCAVLSTAISSTVVDFTHRDRPVIKTISFSAEVRQVSLQTVLARTAVARDTALVGRDSRLAAAVLADGRVVVFDVRAGGRTIDPITEIVPVFTKYHHFLPPSVYTAQEVALNSTVIAVAGPNGITNLYNVFTGEYLREASTKFPKKFTGIYNTFSRNDYVFFNESQTDASGIIMCGEYVQYFQFGDLESVAAKTAAKKRVNVGLLYSNKQENYQRIKDQVGDYDLEEEKKKKSHQLFDKYNGTKYDDEDDEMSMALAISQSYRSKKDLEEEEELRKAMELSAVKEPESEEEMIRRAMELSKEPEREPESEEEMLRRVMELSLVEQ